MLPVGYWHPPTHLNLTHRQCDQSGRFIAPCAMTQSLWQHLIYPNLLLSYAIFVKISKSFIFLVKSYLGNFYRHLAIFIWSHCPWLTTANQNVLLQFRVITLLLMILMRWPLPTFIIISLRMSSHHEGSPVIKSSSCKHLMAFWLNVTLSLGAILISNFSKKLKYLMSNIKTSF